MLYLAENGDCRSAKPWDIFQDMVSGVSLPLQRLLLRFLPKRFRKQSENPLICVSEAARVQVCTCQSSPRMKLMNV